MAVALGGVGNVRHASFGGGTFSTSYSYTSGTGSNRLILVGAGAWPTSRNITTASYAGASLTNVDTNSSYPVLLGFSKVAQATGANTVTIGINYGYAAIFSSVLDFQGVDQSVPLGLVNKAGATNPNPSSGSITCPANGMIFATCYTGYTSGGGALSPSSGVDIGNVVGSGFAAMAAEYNTSTMSLTWTRTNSGWETLGWPINPVAAGGAVIKTVDGLALASNKTIDGLALASIKTRNGLAAN